MPDSTKREMNGRRIRFILLNRIPTRKGVQQSFKNENLFPLILSYGFGPLETDSPLFLIFHFFLFIQRHRCLFLPGTLRVHCSCRICRMRHGDTGYAVGGPLERYALDCACILDHDSISRIEGDDQFLGTGSAAGEHA